MPFKGEFMNIPSGMELILILFVVVLLFGAKKIPELAKGIGEGLKEFRKASGDEEAVEKSKEKED